MNGAPPICENCRRVVHKTRKVHAADCFGQAAPWIDQRPVGQP